jgi:hypothetical protein
MQTKISTSTCKYAHKKRANATTRSGVKLETTQKRATQQRAYAKTRKRNNAQLQKRARNL